MIGGNTEALLQRKTGSTYNHIGEQMHEWSDYHRFESGWLDLSAGDSKHTYNAKLQESTHIFITDYAAIDSKANDKRMVINGTEYDVLLIDDPMELHEQLEIYLKYVG